MEKIYEDAVVKFNSGYNCAQAVFAALAPELGYSQDEALKIGTAFGGGVVGQQYGLCGVVSGALMAIGAARYELEKSPAEAKAAVYELSKSFIKEFKVRHEAIDCLGLIGEIDFAGEEGRRRMSEGGVKKNQCELYVKDACRIVLELIK